MTAQITITDRISTVEARIAPRRRWDDSVLHFTNSTYHIQASAYFPTADERDAYLALFPKSSGVKATRIGCRDENGNSVEYPGVRFSAKISADGVNGGVNETGIKRFRQVIRTVARHDLPATLDHMYNNQDPAEFFALIEEQS